jgi:hypothetical protein
VLYCYQQRYIESESLLLDALAICQHRLGNHHPDTYSTYSSLVALYDAMSAAFKLQGRYDKVTEYLEKAITLRSQLLQ